MVFWKRILGLNRYFIISFIRVCENGQHEVANMPMSTSRGRYPHQSTLNRMLIKCSPLYIESNTLMYVVINIQEVSRRDYDDFVNGDIYKKQKNGRNE